MKANTAQVPTQPQTEKENPPRVSGNRTLVLFLSCCQETSGVRGRIRTSETIEMTALQAACFSHLHTRTDGRVP